MITPPKIAVPESSFETFTDHSKVETTPELLKSTTTSHNTYIMLTMTEDTPGPDPDATATADDTQEEGLILNIPPANHTAASLLTLTKRSSTKKTLDKYDLDGNGDIDSDEVQIMAKDLNAANKQVVVVEKDKNSKYSNSIDFI